MADGFLAYLSGIETSLLTMKFGHIQLFLAYLSGIETIIALLLAIIYKLFLAYLSGIETEHIVLALL